jgi:hypothetical protein
MIEAFPADRADQPFGVAVVKSSQLHSLGAIAVPDRVTRDLLPAIRLCQLT